MSDFFNEIHVKAEAEREELKMETRENVPDEKFPHWSKRGNAPELLNTIENLAAMLDFYGIKYLPLWEINANTKEMHFHWSESTQIIKSLVAQNELPAAIVDDYLSRLAIESGMALGFRPPVGNELEWMKIND